MLAARTHGEAAVILEVFTQAHGRHAGVVRGGNSRKMRPHLQPGGQVEVDWSARLEEHLGSFRVEPKRSRAGAVMGDRLALEALSAMAAVLTLALPEREPVPGIYHLTMDLADRLGGPDDWLAYYALWEVALLAELGFALDLQMCAVTGAREGLAYVSPKTGRAVTRAGAGEFADRLLPLPAFLWQEGANDTGRAEVAQALRLTGYFLRSQIVLPAGKEALPAARARLVDVLGRG